MRKRWIGLIVSLVIAAGALAGCSGNAGTPATPSANAAGAQQSEQPKGAAGTPETAKPENSGWPITDAAGNTAEFKQRPERIAVLHPLYLDSFFALDTPPIASGNAASSMKEFATLQPYRGKAEIADLGSGGI